MHRAHVSADPSASHSGSQDSNKGGGGEGEASVRGVTLSAPHHLAPLAPIESSSYRRSSSGYHSVESDSLPASPRVVAATQTPSPPAQALQHARASFAGEKLVSQANFAVHPHSWLGDETGAMQALAFGQDLRRIGDDYNDYILRRGARPAAGVHNWLPLPHFHQDPGFLFCAGVACIVIIWYSCGGDPPGRGEPPWG
ncbi:bcl-2-like protein 11 [Stigmatopora nigra]